MSKRLHETEGSRPTVHDVARAASVSTATVSRVLNSPADVSQVLRDKVVQTMDQLGYVRDSTARALATRRSYLCGLLLPPAIDAFSAGLLASFEKFSTTNGFGTLVVRAPWTSAGISAGVRQLLEHGVEGIFAAGPVEQITISPLLSGRGVPVVCIAEAKPSSPAKSGPANSGDDDNPEPDICIDMALAGAIENLAVQLKTVGHRQLAIVTEPAAANPLAGKIADLLIAAAISLDFKHTVMLENKNFVEAGGQAFLSLRQLPSPPTAIITTSENLATGVLFEAGRTGLSIPGDFTLVGIITRQFARSTNPALSGIDIDPDEIGQLAAKNLMAKIADEPVSAIVRQPVAFTIRDSIGPPNPH